MDAIAPITWLLEQMEQGAIEEETCKKAVRSSLQLLGNATAHFNVERRKEIMKHLNTDIKSFWRRQNFLKVVLICLMRTLEAKQKQQLTTSEHLKRYPVQ